MSDPVIMPNVRIGANPKIGKFVVLGVLPRDGRAIETSIGDDANLRSHSVIYSGVTVGDRFFCGHHVTVREGCRIGNDVSVGTGSIVEHDVLIEDGVRVHSGAFVPENTILRKGCWIGPRVCFTNAKYPTLPGVKENLVGPEVGPGAIIGANATILPGVKIGAKAVVGAGSVVTKNVAPGVVVAGNPARPVKSAEELSYRDAT